MRLITNHINNKLTFTYFDTRFEKKFSNRRLIKVFFQCIEILTARIAEWVTIQIGSVRRIADSVSAWDKRLCDPRQLVLSLFVKHSAIQEFNSLVRL